MHVHGNIPYYLTMSSILLNNNNILVTTYLSTKYPYLSLYSILMCFCWGEHPLHFSAAADQLMWCIGKITSEYRQRMYDLLELYARPYREDEPVICVNEKSKQLLQQSRTPIPVRPGAPVKEDYEYRRAGTRNIFLAVEPKGGHRQAEATARPPQ